jgi:hypothetical protein
MPAGIQPTPSDAPVGQNKKGSAGNVAAIPFARSSKWHIEQSNTQSGITLASNSQVFNYPLSSYGYLSAIFITVALTGSSGASSLTYYEDAPWSLIQQIQVSDVNGVPIYQLSGYHAYLAAKYGGYRFFPPNSIIHGDAFDTATAGSATATSQTVLAGGPLAATYGGYYQNPTASSSNCRFVLPVFFEFGRDGLGCLPNMDNSARYNLQITVAGGAATAAATGPYIAGGTVGTAPTMAITVEVLCRSQPPATDMFGNQNSVAPPAVGTVQYWTSQTASGLANGANTIQLTRVGNLIRNHILVWRNSTTSANPRAVAETADFPSLFEMDWDSGQRYIANTSTLRAITYAGYGFDSPNGVLVLPNTGDPDKLFGSEYGDEWMGTVGATKLTLRYSPGASASGGSLTIITNDIVPASAQIYQAPALSIG